VLAWSRGWVSFFAAIAGSNHSGDVIVCLLRVFINVLVWVILQQAAVIRNYQYSLRSKAEEHSSKLLRGGNLKSCECFLCQVQVSATGRSLIQSSTIKCVCVCVCVCVRVCASASVIE